MALLALPELPLFAAPRVKAVLRACTLSVKHCSERFATLSFDVQKTQRLHQAFSRFIGSHLGVAFEADPAEIRKLNTRRGA